ncbi:SCO3374 family protein [Streptomyces sp. NPDC021356]|uniref:SCO3374 family protein n=1 Tax=Streptomyces sp. NPDC021356 TaxID=3154900 RepID=UPI0033C7B0D2
MVGSLPTIPLPVPPPRRPLDPGDRARHWYENELGWATVPGAPVRLVVGRRFDVLDVPLEAGRAALRHPGLRPGVPASPVAVQADRMRLLVAAGSAEELPGLLRWLEWDALDLDLVGLGAGTQMDAPTPPGTGSRARERPGPQGAAEWLRPPEPGREVETSLPAMSAVSALGGGGGAPDLVRLVNTVATHCHRIRLRRACGLPMALPRAFGP